jgi:hypothetical protein
MSASPLPALPTPPRASTASAPKSSFHVGCSAGTFGAQQFQLSTALLPTSSTVSAGYGCDRVRRGYRGVKKAVPPAVEVSYDKGGWRMGSEDEGAAVGEGDMKAAVVTEISTARAAAQTMFNALHLCLPPPPPSPCPHSPLRLLASLHWETVCCADMPQLRAIWASPQ